MSFDPENVERFPHQGDHGYINYAIEYVLATDYDQLLELFRESKRKHNGDQSLQCNWSDARYRSEVERQRNQEERPGSVELGPAANHG